MDWKSIHYKELVKPLVFPQRRDSMFVENSDSGEDSTNKQGRIEEQINIETLEQLKLAFAEADANQSGQLDLEEFKALLKTRLYIKGNKENQIDALFMKIDWSSEGVISWDEFCTYMQLEYAEKEDSYLRSKEVNFHLPAKIQNPQHKNPILKITDTQDGTFIACSQDGMVTFWGANVELKETKYVVNTEAKNKQKTKWITDFVIMAQWKKVLVGTGDREIQFFDSSSYKPYCQISSLETVPLKLDYCATGSDECLILFGDSDGCINILVINSVGECLRTWNKLPSKEGFIAEISLSDAISKSKIQFIRWKVHGDWVQQLKYYHEIGQVISCSNHQETALVIGCTTGSTRVDQGGNSYTEKAKKTNAKLRLDADQKVFYVYKGVKCFDFSKDKNIIVTGGMDRIVRLWNPYVSDKPTAMLRGHNAPIFYLFIANDENRVFSLSTDKCIKVWDILDHNCLLTVRPKGHKIRGDLQACHYSSAAKSMAIATDQMAILNLKQKPTKHADITITHKEPVTCVRYNPSFKQVITCSESSVIKLWDLETGTPIFEYGDAHGDSAITCMTFDNTGRRLITGGRDGILKIWNYNNGHCLKVLKKEEENDEICDITYVEMNRNRYVVSVGWDKRINIYSDSVTDVNIHHVQHPNPNWSDDLKDGHKEDILSVAQCPPNLLATSGYDGEIIVWNMVSGHIFCHLSAPVPSNYEDQSLDGDLSINKLLFIQSRAYNKDSASLIASGPRAHIHFWNVFQGGTLMAQFPGSTTKGAMISTMAITDTSDGNEDEIMLIVGDSYGFLFLFDISGYCLMASEEDPPELIHSWRGHIDSITCMELVEKHKLLMTASTDCTVRLWNFDGDYIGTFGQPDPWDIYKPSTYRHPMVPYDVLIDPMSLPSHPVIEEKKNTQQIIHEGENGHLKTPQFTFKKEQFYIDDETIAKELHKLQSILKDESLTEEQAKAYKGKWLRHEKTKIKEIDRGGPIFFVADVWTVCPVKWTEHNGNCYFFSTQAYRYNEADILCSSRNSTLAILKNNDDWAWLRSQLKTLQSDIYWIGLRVSNRTWTWLDGTTYNATNVHWLSDKEPSVTNARASCAAMMSYSGNYGRVYARYCLESRRVICEKPNDSFELCDSSDNWEFINGFCYKLFEEKSNWFDARAVCQQNNGDLYIPTSRRMIQSLSDLIPCRTPEDKAWLGISDTTWPGRFVDTNNKTLRYQAFYSYGRIIVNRGSTCVYSNPMSNFYWQATLCSDENKFLCEKKAGTCPVGWQSYLDSCYQLNDIRSLQSTWFMAKQYCENQNTSLLIIGNSAEDSFVKQLMNNQKVTTAWIGFSGMLIIVSESQSDVLKWVNVKQCYLVYNVKICGKVQAGSSSSSWSNGYCFISLPFICKAKMITRITNITKPAQTHCNSGWLQYKSDCYLFGNDSLQSWTNARHVCYSYGGDSDLTTIRDPYEQSFITEHIPDIGTSWIGLKYSAEYQKFRWVDSRFVNTGFQNFFPGEPDDVDDGAYCIKIKSGRQDFTGAWDDENCTSPLSFICRKKAEPGAVSTVQPSTTPAPWNAACGQGWISNSLSNTCYKVVLGKPKTWNEALWDCNQMMGTLLNIESVREQHYIQGILSTGVYASIQSNFWIGGSDATREGGWEWINATLPFAYLNWHPGEPNEALTGEDCMEMVTSWGYQWNDKRCDHEQQYICKKPAIIPTTTAGAPTPLTPKSCVGQPLISGDYSVLDDRIMASSIHDTGHSAQASRIYPGSKGGWKAQTSANGQLIQVSFYYMAIIKGVVTMGRSDALEWVTSYKIRYQYDYYSEWNWYEEPPGTVKVFTGNTDNVNTVNNTIQFPIEAKAIRLYPVTWHGAISLRWDILGCIEDFCRDEYAVSGPLIVDDNKITVSSMSDPNHSNTAARLHSLQPLKLPQGWKAAVDDSNQWIQVDLGKSMKIRGITTMGSAIRQEWVTSYNVIYRVDTQENFYQEPYGNVKTIPGNVNNNDTATYFFKLQFEARYIKIIPITFHGGISMRFDVLVCQHGCNAEPLINGRKKLPDDLINASSSVDNDHGPARSRLNQPSQGTYAGAWVPLYQDTHQYIEADFGVGIQIVAIATQGRQERSEWVTQYTLSYSVDGAQWLIYDAFTRVPIKFEGNFDSNTVRKHYLSIPMIARKIRLWPTNFHTRIALRWEIYGCPGADSGTRVGCYADNPHDRDLTYEPFTDPAVGMWPPMCVHHCFNKGYYYAGLQAQFKCFCGNSYGRYGPATDCNLSCFPLTRYQCGGRQSSMIYTTGLTPANSVCLPDWKDYNNHCYLMILNKYSWSMARSKCQSMGADLVTVNSQAEQDMVYSIISSNQGSDVWIGLNDHHESSLFEWVRGDRVRFTNWNINQPRQPGNTNQKCVMLNSTDGGWQTDNCDSTYQFVCQADKRPSEKPTTTPQVQGCQPGWTAYRWSCYLVLDMPRTFLDAQRVCRDNRATLVQVDDRYEQSYLSSVLGQKTGMYWTDVTDLRSPGTYRNYDNGYPYLTYTNWGNQRPASGTSRCVAMNSGARAGLWYDILCNMTSGAVCEKLRLGFTSPATPPPTTVGVPCPDGWIEINNYCYQVNNMPQNRRAYYDDAQADCRNQGANLASFHSAADASSLWRGQLVGATTNYWIGLDDNHIDGNQKVYRWKDGSSLDYVNWADHEPNNFHGSEDCVELVVWNGKWNDVNCYSKRNWICKIPKGSNSYKMRTTPFAPSAGPPGSCGSDVGWVFYKNHCYLILDGAGNQARTWREARRFCQTKGGDLISVNSVLEQFFIQHQVSPIKIKVLSEVDFGIGYKWSDGSPVSFVNWFPGEPNDFFGAEDCVEIRVANGKWNDEHCSSRRGFVCEKRLGANPTNPAPPKIQGNCPGGYSAAQYSNKCYKVFTSPMSWSNASRFCMGQGREKYYLASITSDLDNTFVTTQLRGLNISPWIGLRLSNGVVRWVDNNDVTYTNWYKGEPNGGPGSTMCGRIYGYQHNAGRWDDFGCDNKEPFICETMRKTYITTPEPTPNPCNSKQGYKPFGNGCFKFVSIPKSWPDARDDCARQGAFLVTISSEFEQAFVRLLVDGVETWTGLNDIKSTGTFTWMNTVWPVIYTAWDAGQPSQQTGACVSMNSTSGKWQTTNCTQSLSYVCKITSDNPPVTPPAPNNLCSGHDWLLNGSKCLLFRPDDYRTYLDATLECQNHGASLVSIHSMAQNQFLLQTIQAKYSVSVEGFWAGLHKSSSSGFTWSDQSPTNFVNWDVNEPSSNDQWGNNENCMEIHSWNGKWNDLDCTQKRGYVCQRNPVSDVNPHTPPQPSNSTFPSPSGTLAPPTPPLTPPTQGPKGSSSTPQGSGKPTINGQTKIPTPPPYTGPSVTGASKGSGGSSALSGGGIAGILIAAIIIAVIVIAVLVIFKRKQQEGGGSLSFENTTYIYEKGQENGKLHLNHQETDSKDEC
ncbi:uncharacterized protein LOC134239370 [Saccostrea cucullata]|uniref:uncharacterized protein LOC134239370 n=1 Tax=Saccostrea cuccullata TaxID=36930 RepID=UPI002ED6BA9D